MGKQRKNEQGHKRSKKKEKGKGWAAEEKTPILNRKCAKRKQQIKKISCPECSNKINETDLSEHLLTSHNQDDSVEESPEVGPSKVRLSPEEQDETTSSEEHDD